MIGVIAIEIFGAAVGNAAGHYWRTRKGGARQAKLNGVAVDLDSALQNAAAATSTLATLREQTQALDAATRALQNCAALFDEKLELLAEASFKAGWVQLGYAAGASDEENMKWYLRQAAAEFGRALGTLKNERLITAHFGAALAQLQLGELTNGLQTLEAVRSIVFDASDPKANFWVFTRLKLEASEYLATLAGQTRFVDKQRAYSQAFERRATTLPIGPTRDQAFALARATRTLESDLQAGANELRAAAFGLDATLNNEAAKVYFETFGVPIDSPISSLRLPQRTPVPRLASSRFPQPASNGAAGAVSPSRFPQPASNGSVGASSLPRVQPVPLPDDGAILRGAAAVCLLTANLVFLLLGVSLELFAILELNRAAFCVGAVSLTTLVLVNNGAAIALRRSCVKFYVVSAVGVFWFVATGMALEYALKCDALSPATGRFCATATNAVGALAFVVALSYCRRFGWKDALLTVALTAAPLFYFLGLERENPASKLELGLTIFYAAVLAALLAKALGNLLSANVRRVSEKTIAASAFGLYALFYIEVSSTSASFARWEAFLEWAALCVWAFSLFLKLQEGNGTGGASLR